MTSSINSDRRVDAQLFDDDLKSGKFNFDRGMERVAEASSDALDASAQPGARKAKGGHGGKSGTASQAAEVAEDAFEQGADDSHTDRDPECAIGGGTGPDAFPVLPGKEFV